MSLPSASERLRKLDHAQIHNIGDTVRREIRGMDSVLNWNYKAVRKIAEIIADELEFEERMEGT